MYLIAIAAIGPNRELGWKGDMPWKRALKKDLAYFKKTTLHHPIVMGQRTFASLPGFLPDRKHIVITHQKLPAHEQLEVYPSLEAFYQAWQDRDEILYVTGGASLYEQMLPACQEILLTEIEGHFEADTWFPFLDPACFEKEVLEEIEDGGYQCRRIRYRRCKGSEKQEKKLEDTV